MTPTESPKDKVVRYYDQEAASYADLYTKGAFEQEFYPANGIRFEIVLDVLRERNARTVLDVGCGSGQPLVRLLRKGYDARGVDFSSKMVEHAQTALRDAGLDPARVSHADLESENTLPAGPFDAIIATGVFPHNLDDAAAYANLRRLLVTGGTALVEYRNALMALFSLNERCTPFFWEELLRGNQLPETLREATRSFLAGKLDTPLEKVGAPRDIEYSDILARFHNPLTLGGELSSHGLHLFRVHYYHWHAAPPHLEKKYKKEFWEESLRLERGNDWRGMFLCSAYVAEIVKP